MQGESRAGSRSEGCIERLGAVGAGDMLLRHGGGSSEGCLSSDMAAKLSSLNLPSSMDIARYLEQVQFVDLPEASPRKYAQLPLPQSPPPPYDFSIHICILCVIIVCTSQYERYPALILVCVGGRCLCRQALMYASGP